MATAAAEQADAERAEQREDRQADQRVDPDERGAGGAGEGAVGDGVGHERRSAQDHEEADHPGDGGDDVATIQALTMNPENTARAA